MSARCGGGGCNGPWTIWFTPSRAPRKCRSEICSRICGPRSAFLGSRLLCPPPVFSGCCRSPWSCAPRCPCDVAAGGSVFLDRREAAAAVVLLWERPMPTFLAALRGVGVGFSGLLAAGGAAVRRCRFLFFGGGLSGTCSGASSSSQLRSVMSMVDALRVVVLVSESVCSL